MIERTVVPLTELGNPGIDFKVIMKHLVWDMLNLRISRSSWTTFFSTMDFEHKAEIWICESAMEILAAFPDNENVENHLD